MAELGFECPVNSYRWIALHTDQWDEAAGDLMRDDRPSLLSGDELEELRFGGADGDDQAPAFAQLVEEGLRESGCSCGDDDAVEGRPAGQTAAAVSDLDGEVGVSQDAQNFIRSDREFGMTFDRIDMLAQLREQCRLVSGASADFENYFFLRRSEKFQHECNDVRLRNCLGLADGKRIVVVSLFAIRLGYEFVARNAGHRGQDMLVANSPLAQLGLDHLLSADGGGGGGGRFQGFLVVILQFSESEITRRPVRLKLNRQSC